MNFNYIFCRYSLMLNCWQFNPHKRAQFPETVQKLDKILSLAVPQVDILEEIASCDRMEQN